MSEVAKERRFANRRLYPPVAFYEQGSHADNFEAQARENSAAANSPVLFARIPQDQVNDTIHRFSADDGANRAVYAACIFKRE